MTKDTKHWLERITWLSIILFGVLWICQLREELKRTESAKEWYSCFELFTVFEELEQKGVEFKRYDENGNEL